MYRRHISAAHALAVSASLGAPIAAAHATLYMEPVIDFVPGSGPSATVFPMANTVPNGATGQPFDTATRPGEIDEYSAGFPRDAILTSVAFYNNTQYNITSIKLAIIGSSFEPIQYTFTITRDPNVDAFWGDANGDGKVGLSDIFSNIALSDNNRTLTLSGGVIPVGGRFTDYLYSYTTDGLTFRAGVDASFDGVFVPEPAGLTLLASGIGILLLGRRGRNAGRLTR